MKVIFENKYIKSYQFNIEKEFRIFFENQQTVKNLILKEQGGEFWHCYLGYHSITSDKLFAIGFDSDSKQEELTLLYWSKSKLMVFDNGNEIFIVNNDLELIASHKIITPLIGLYVTESNSLLVLEEATMKLISQKGEMLKNEQFDLLNDYNIVDNKLHVKTDVMYKVIEL